MSAQIGHARLVYFQKPSYLPFVMNHRRIARLPVSEPVELHQILHRMMRLPLY